MLNYRDFVNAFRELGLGRGSRVIVHVSLSAFGGVGGGASTIIGALIATFETVVMPTFTYRTMIIPPMGPADNGMEYGSGQEQNLLAEIFQPDLPADQSMGVTAETLRKHPDVARSSHPILSFAGVNADLFLESQSLQEPLGIIKELAEGDGDVLLLGVDHSANTSLHYAEKLAGRRQFTRWALTPEGVVECPGFPGCSQGFDAISPRLTAVTREIQLGEGTIQAVPMRDLLHIAVGWIREDPQALLCERPSCERCTAVRDGVSRAA